MIYLYTTFHMPVFSSALVSPSNWMINLDFVQPPCCCFTFYKKDLKVTYFSLIY